MSRTDSYQRSGPVACKSLLACGVVLVFALGFVACTPEKGSSRKPRSQSPLLIVTQEANGSQVNLVPGQEMVIQLVRNIRDQKTWSLAGKIDKDVLVSVGQRTVPTTDAAGGPGSQGIEELRFKAGSGGVAVLDLAYVPENGQLAEATNRFFLRVVVDQFDSS